MEMAIALAETTCSTYTNLDDVFKLFDFFVICDCQNYIFQS